MMMNLVSGLWHLVPGGPVKEAAKGAYYYFYNSERHFKKAGFRISYKDRRYEFDFPNGIRFKCRENIDYNLRDLARCYLARYSLRPGDTVIDCGAYVGDFTLYAAKAVGESGRVVAFEPDNGYYVKLAENIELNGLKNVTLIKKGVWSRSGKLRFSGGGVTAHFLSQDTGDKAASYDVPVATIDKEMAMLGIEKTAFIKMDIEGAEIEALKGAEGTLKGQNVNLAIASYHIVNGNKSCYEVEKILKGYGYDAETGFPVHLTTYAKKNR